MKKLADSLRVRGDDKVYGVGDIYWDYPMHLVKIGWRTWKETGRFIPVEEIGQLDPRWVSDILAMDELFQAVNRETLHK